MSLSVQYNGEDLSKFLYVLDGYTIHGGADWDPSYNEIKGLNGVDFIKTRRKEKTISMPFAMKNKLNEKYDVLQQILTVDSPKKLVFGNAQDRYFLAVPKGDLNFDEINKNGGKGEIKWLVCDGLAHSTVEKEFSAAANENGILEATIINDGTAEVAVDYVVTHNHENGYIGIVSEYGAIQLGNADEVDMETRQKSEVLVNYKNYADYSAMTDNQGLWDGGHSEYPKNGSWGKYVWAGLDWLGLTNAGSGSSWHGATKTITLPADSHGETGSKNFWAQTRIWAETGLVTQTGTLQMVIGDENGKHLASMHFVKKSSTDNTASMVMQVQEKEIKRIKYEPTAWSSTGNTGSNIYIRKTGELFEFYFAGQKYQFRYPELSNKKGLTLTLCAGQYGSRGMGTLLARMYFRDTFFRKDSVNYLYDIPNRYRAGSVVSVDGNAAKVYVDGIPSLDDEVLGSKYFKVPPGETKVQFYYSSFSSPPPAITAKIREAYI